MILRPHRSPVGSSSLPQSGGFPPPIVPPAALPPLGPFCNRAWHPSSVSGSALGSLLQAHSPPPHPMLVPPKLLFLTMPRWSPAAGEPLPVSSSPAAGSPGTSSKKERASPRPREVSLCHEWRGEAVIQRPVPGGGEAGGAPGCFGQGEASAHTPGKGLGAEGSRQGAYPRLAGPVLGTAGLGPAGGRAWGR